MVDKSCVICGGEESEGELLVEAPCRSHWVCPDDVASFFEQATYNESLFPPKCCGQMFMLQEYEDYVPFDIAWPYQVKEHGEYAVLAKFRVYCGNPPCARFLHPSSHVTDQETNITYAICEHATCGKLTCTSCKALLDQGTQNHICKKDEDEEKFRQTANKNGYQECKICGATVELAEACNHITCGCGHDFCYVCGKDWNGLHGCPHYGPATYDEEGYNQDGYHRDTGLNRDGLTRRQDNTRRQDDDPDEEDEFDEEEEDPDWEVLQHLTPDQRIMVNNLMRNDRDDALDQLRIELFETRGITFEPRLQARVDPQILQHITPLAGRMIDEVAMNQEEIAEAYEQITHQEAQQISPQIAQQLLQEVDPQFNPQQHAQINPQLVQEFTQNWISPRALQQTPLDMRRLAEELISHLVVRATQIANEQVDEEANEQDEDQAPVGEENANDGTVVGDEGSATFSESGGSSDDTHNNDDGDYMIDDQVPFQGERFADDQSDDDNMDLYDEPPASAAETMEAKQPLWGPPGGWPQEEDEEL